jgi:putative DNA primase/helicase
MTLQCIEVARAAGIFSEKPSGKEMLFRCPRHEDRHPSLSINPGKNCWLCGPCGKSGNAWELAAFLSGNDPLNRKAVSAWLRDHGLRNGRDGWEFVCDYVYKAENGDPLFRVKRYRTRTGKTFVQERFDGSSWIGGEGCMQGVKLVPYRLPEWKDSKSICIVEGEKDADRLWSLGIPSTCNPGGAGKRRPEFNSLFAGKEVVIFPDNDEPGNRHARDVALG